MQDRDTTELPGLERAVAVIEDHIRRLDQEGRAATADGRVEVDEARAHELMDARHGTLVRLRDELYARITELGGQWPDTEVGAKQPPTGGAEDA